MCENPEGGTPFEALEDKVRDLEYRIDQQDKKLAELTSTVRIGTDMVARMAEQRPASTIEKVPLEQFLKKAEGEMSLPEQAPCDPHLPGD